MASILTTIDSVFTCRSLSMAGLKPIQSRGGRINGGSDVKLSFGAVGSSRQIQRQRRMVVVRAEGETINPAIRKTEEKVVDSVVVTELSKPLTAYCRCWRSGTFPLCDGSHVKHNKANGDNVGPLLLKKQ